MEKQLELRGTVHRCMVCRRELRNPDSIKAGIGPKCIKKGLCGKATKNLDVVRDT